MLTFTTFIGFTVFVAFYVWHKLRKEKLNSSDGYFLAGRSLSGVVIAGSMLLTNISTEHLVGMNGSAYKNGLIIITWEVTATFALIVAAFYFVPTYLRLGVTTIPEYLEKRFDPVMRSIVAFFLVLSFVIIFLPIVLYTGAINLESIFNVSETFGISKSEGMWLTVIVVGVIGSLYAVFGGLKAVAISDTINGYGLLVGGLMIPLLALFQIGDGNPVEGLERVYERAPEKFNVVGTSDSVLPFSVLFTGLIINQLYFWGMHQTIIQRALGAKNLKEAQKGLLLTGVLKLFVPFIIALPGVIAFYYLGDSMYEDQDRIYPELVKRVLPLSLLGLFAAVVMGAVLSTFNSVLNSAATIFSIDVYKRLINENVTEKRLVKIGRIFSAILAFFVILSIPLVSQAPEGLYQLLQQLTGIFYIPIGSIMLASFFMKKVSALGARAGLIFGFLFYITCVFIVKVDLHFVHIWGIEFVLNVIVMYAVSYYFPRKNYDMKASAVKIEMKPWKYLKPFSIFLVIATLLLYISLGKFS